MDSDKTLVIDGMALLFRHFFATSFRNQFMINEAGVPTNGTQGMIRHTLKLLEILKPSRMIITWDMGSETIRNEWFKDYKKNRTAPPEELIPQFDYVKEVIDDIGFCQTGISGYEADDIIGTLSKKYDDLIIVSGDRDLLQLLDGTNDIWLTKKGFTEYNMYTKDLFEAQYGIHPEQFIDVKALMGDPGDGYFGVKGIGEKTALKLIREHGSIEQLLLNLDSLTPSVKSKIEADRASLDMSLRLARIITDVPVDINLVETRSPLSVNPGHIKSVLEGHNLTISSRYVGTLDL
ncbi:5'-3' exonuclease [Salinicoccus carnicancri]|uniref:5'-3' exonuclease n=1 Tax=Salinicoccus carnicancri TaxID=558170 RepID=UPI00058B18EA|nr:5'-3' exonuclease [Salinicoccus carnicancri]